MHRSLAARAVELRKKNGEDVDIEDKEGVYNEWKGVKVGKQVLMSVLSYSPSTRPSPRPTLTRLFPSSSELGLINLAA